MNTTTENSIHLLPVIKTTSLPDGLKIAMTAKKLRQIEVFRKEVFAKLYPELGDFHNDQHDKYSITLYTENTQGEIMSTARIVFDSDYGLPADDYAKSILAIHRSSGLKLAEISRFAISDEARKLGLLPVYYRAFYVLTAENDVDSMVIVIHEKSVGFHQKRIGAEFLIEKIPNICGSKFDFACMEWKVKETKAPFFKWVHLKKQESYTESEWNDYSESFSSILTDVQRQLYQEASQYLSGDVVDLGCGSARLAPLLSDDENITSYVGIEYAEGMVKIANFTMSNISNPSFCVIQQKIEEATGVFTSAVSLQSFYSWTEPEQVLTHIFGMLLSGSLFVLATPNKNLDQRKLFKEAEKELMWHPHFEQFREYNLKLADNPLGNFIEMDDLVKKVQTAGFKIVVCHQQHYDGGVNFIVCQKP